MLSHHNYEHHCLDIDQFRKETNSEEWEAVCSFTELLQHVMVLLCNYNTSGEGSRKRCLSVCSVSSVVGEEFDVRH